MKRSPRRRRWAAVWASGASAALVLSSIVSADAEILVPSEGSPFNLLGSQPVALTTADFNDDGKTDVALTTAGFFAVPGTIEIWLGDGAGGLAPHASWEIPGGGGGIAAGLMDDDDHLDLVITQPPNDCIRFVYGDGAGGGSLTSCSAIGDQPTAILAGPFVGVFSDLIVAFQAESAIRVLKQGPGGYTAHGPIPVLGPPGSMVAAELDADGRPDLVVTTPLSTQQLRLLHNDGAGGFSLYASIGGLPNAGTPAAADLTGDGFVDVAVPVPGANAVAVLAGSAGGTLTPVPGSPFATGGVSPTAVTIGSFFAGGGLDLAVANALSRDVTLLTNNGSGQFTSVGSFPVSGSGSANPGMIASSDFNSDGRPDVVTGNRNTDDLSLFLDLVPPGVVTGSATGVTATSATVNGSVNPHGTPGASWWFEYGPTSTYGSSTPVTALGSAPSSPQTVSRSLTGLTRGETYHYRLVTKIGQQTFPGPDRMFSTALPGDLLIDAWRPHGPGGPADQYVELYNAGPGRIDLEGFTLRTEAAPSTPAFVPLPNRYLEPDQYLLATRSGFSLTGSATGDVALPAVSLLAAGVVTPDSRRLDAVGLTGPGLQLREGSPLPPPTASTGQYAFERRNVAGVPVDTDVNAGDFVLVATDADVDAHGAAAVLGSPTPHDSTAPRVSNLAGYSRLLDPGVAAAQSPNRTVSGSTVVFRRTLTNQTTDTVTSMRLRLTSLTTYGSQQVYANQAILTAMSSADHTIAGHTVKGLTLEQPYGAAGGGLGSVLTVPLPPGGLAPNASVDVAIAFTIRKGGSFSFGYNVEVK